MFLMNYSYCHSKELSHTISEVMHTVVKILSVYLTQSTACIVRLQLVNTLIFGPAC